MKYMIIGAGGTGGAIGGFLSRAEQDVTVIARGEHLKQMQQAGLQFETPDASFTVPVKACTMEEYKETPDVIFVCVKGYSLSETIPFIRQVAASHTVVIPILNIYGTGKKLQDELPHLCVTDGCIYIAAQISKPGVILMSGRIFRIVYGLRQGTSDDVRRTVMPVLEQIREDLAKAGIAPLLSCQVERDTLQKFSFVSPMAAIGAGYDAAAQAVQAQGPMRDTFIALIEEIKALSEAMGIGLPDDLVSINLKIMDDLAPTATSSLHRDLRAGKPSEIDGLIYEVVRLAGQYGVCVPAYEAITARLKG